MNDRRHIGPELLVIERNLKELQSLYERYFAGVEKLEPVKQREQLARSLRQFANRRIVQTDLRFQYQNLAQRFHAYAGYWDRILRLMDEGRFVRGAVALPKPPPEAKPAQPATGAAEDEVAILQRQLREAGARLGADDAQERARITRFLDEQRQKIRAAFGEKAVEFRVVVEDGKPHIKVRAKK
ncbi:hypothetical protein [Geoalkalibacter sp.]|uniref:hypothetical protein n=1 Tax=Geoalkalibacter sp. TaxID=3041440 RepID=UPI00272E8198|nr:hypothetical protein [Geoalkalibacter sp.]